jgi:DHHC palmitoyltransferase
LIKRSDLTKEQFKENNEVKDLYGNMIKKNLNIEQFVVGDEKDPKKIEKLLEQHKTIQFESTFGIYEYRYCSTCKIARPPLSSHCNTCGYCVKGYDQ